VKALARLSGDEIAIVEDMAPRDMWGRCNALKSYAHHLLSWLDVLPWLDGRASEITAVYHLGAITDTTCTDVNKLYWQNTDFTIKLWRWCGMHDVPIVYASSASTYGDGEHGFSESTPLNDLRPLNPYAGSKHNADVAIEALAHDSDVPSHWYGLKFFNVYGPGEQHKGKMQSFITKSVDAFRSGGKIKLFGNARYSTRDWVHVDDAVDVMLWLMQARPVSGIYNVGSGRATSFGKVISAIIPSDERAWSDCVEMVDMPEELRGRYQHYTRADITKLWLAGYHRYLRDVRAGVSAYITSLKEASSAPQM